MDFGSCVYYDRGEEKSEKGEEGEKVMYIYAMNANATRF